MRRLVPAVFVLIAVLYTFGGCSKQAKLLDSQTFLLTQIATDPTYGFSSSNPIKVGGVKSNQGPLNERRFLNALAGPNGERISYFRAGSCCPTPSKNGFMGSALLDIYRVSYQGSSDTVSLYINMYDFEKLMAPKGFTIKSR